jgi:signal peptidase II
LKRKYHLIFWPAVVIVLLDQITKAAVLKYFQIHQSLPIINGLLNLVHVRNRGMAFGVMNRPHSGLSFYLLVGASLGALALLLFWVRKLKDEEMGILLGLSLVLGGAVGNLIDRVRFHEVIDFIDFYVGQYHWPAFNVADAAITVGTFLVAISLIFSHKS